MTQPLRWAMMGTGVFAAPTFEAVLEADFTCVALFTQPDRFTGHVRGSSRLQVPVMKTIAEKHAIPIYQPESINTPEGVELLKSLNVDLFVVAAYGQILSRDVLAVPRLGGINVHASLLPKFRGAAPIHWAILKGEAETGVTIIQMSIGLDAGKILAQEPTPIGSEETSGELELCLAPIGARLAVDVIRKLAKGETLAGVVQNKALVTKAPKLTKEMGLVDWSQSSRNVDCQVRAMQPWPTAYTYLHRPNQPAVRLIVGKVKPADAPPSPPTNVKPGDVLTVGSPIRCLVRTGDGWAELLELQPAGKKKMTADQFLRGIPNREGLRLGGEAG